MVIFWFVRKYGAIYKRRRLKLQADYFKKPPNFAGRLIITFFMLNFFSIKYVLDVSDPFYGQINAHKKDFVDNSGFEALTENEKEAYREAVSFHDFFICYKKYRSLNEPYQYNLQMVSLILLE